MQLFIPQLGTRLRIIQDWHFTLLDEQRNRTLMERIGVPHVEYDTVGTGIPADTKARYPRWKEGELYLLKVKPPTFNQVGVDLGARMLVVGVNETTDMGWLTQDVTPDRDTMNRVRKDQVAFQMKLPAGTVLVMDRIYVRKGNEEFDSVTFLVESCPTPGLKGTGKKGFLTGKVRFWVRLDEANTMQCEPVAEQAAA